MHINYLASVRKDYLGKIGLILLFFVLTIALIGPFLPLYAPLETSQNILEAPSSKHWLGTNDVGQDILSRLIYGSRTSLLVCVSTGVLTVFLATILGCTAAMAGGIVDRIIMRIVDIFLTLPNIILIILISSYIRPSLVSLILILSFLNWPGSTRIIRTQTLNLQNKVHVLAAQTFGASKVYILFRHIIPDLLPILSATFIHQAKRAVFMESGLAFLGIVDSNLISWGAMLNNALRFSYLNIWYWLLPPGICLSLTILGFSYVGVALEKVMDPRLKGGNHA